MQTPKVSQKSLELSEPLATRNVSVAKDDIGSLVRETLNVANEARDTKANIQKMKSVLKGAGQKLNNQEVKASLLMQKKIAVNECQIRDQREIAYEKRIEALTSEISKRTRHLSELNP